MSPEELLVFTCIDSIVGVSWTWGLAGCACICARVKVLRKVLFAFVFGLVDHCGNIYSLLASRVVIQTYC